MLTDCQLDHQGENSSYFKTRWFSHYHDVIMSPMASQITNPTSVYSIVYSGTDQRKHQSSASLAFVRGFHRWPVNSPHKGPVTRKMFPFDDVIMMAAILFRPLCLDYNVQYKVYKESNKNNLNTILSFIPFDKAKCLFVEHFKQILTCLLFGVSQLLHNIGCDYSERLYYSKCWSKDCHIMYKNSRAVSAFIGHIPAQTCI